MITVIGNTPVDLIADVSDDFLAQHKLDKGFCTTITLEQQDVLLKAATYRQVPGGSGANLAACLSLLGLPIHYIGPFGDDELGHFAVQSLSKLGVACAPYMQAIPNQIVFTYLTPDGERSFAAFYDDRCDVPADQIDLSGSTRALVDGYTILSPLYQKAIREALEAYKGSIVFCPNDVSVVLEAPEMAQWLYNRADILVMNRDEAKMLLAPHKTETILHRLQEDGKRGALTSGAEGAVVFTPDNSFNVPSVLDPADFVDSNGAGDAFTAGYLYGLEQNWDLDKIGQVASRCAAVVLATSGARAPADFNARVFEKAL